MERITRLIRCRAPRCWKVLAAEPPHKLYFKCLLGHKSQKSPSDRQFVQTLSCSIHQHFPVGVAPNAHDHGWPSHPHSRRGVEMPDLERGCQARGHQQKPSSRQSTGPIRRPVADPWTSPSLQLPRALLHRGKLRPRSCPTGRAVNHFGTRMFRPPLVEVCDDSVSRAFHYDLDGFQFGLVPGQEPASLPTAQDYR